MIYEADCSKCDKEYQVEEWIKGSCPHCDAKYTWDSICTDSDEWVIQVYEE